MLAYKVYHITIESSRSFMKFYELCSARYFFRIFLSSKHKKAGAPNKKREVLPLVFWVYTTELNLYFIKNIP